MRIAVCVKQVPSVAALRFDPVNKTLQREGVPLEINSFDLRALAWAKEFKQKFPNTEILAVTLGPPQARAALVDALALAADRAVLLTDPAFRGSDTLATARALAAFFRRNASDIILCGRYSVDAETSQVGPELAELLRIPHVSMVRRIALDSSSAQVLELERETDFGWEVLHAAMPVLLTVTESIAPEKFPSKSERDAAENRAIEEISAAELGLSPKMVGFAGSPTWVRELSELPNPRRQQVISEATLEQSVARAVRILVEEYGAFAQWKSPSSNYTTPQQPQDIEVEPRDVLVVGETLNGEVQPVTWELIGKALELARGMAGKVHLAIFSEGPANFADAFHHYGKINATVFVGPACATFQPWEHAARLADLIADVRPRFVIGPSTSYGRDVLPRLAALSGLGLTADCIDLGLGPDGSLLQHKPAFGGSIVATISSRTLPEMATVRPGVFPPLPRQPHASNGDGVKLVECGRPRYEFRLQRLRHGVLPDLGKDLDHAEIVVGVGKGVGAGGIQEVRSFAERIGAVLCTTRDVADEGWLPRQLQVGLTGRSIAPKLYLALGIRGAFEHVVGVRRAGVIVAVNRNPRAPIFRHCDLGLVADLWEVLPILEQQIRAHLQPEDA
ncbi:MAG: FAD-binding protein [Candidatus Binatia bacterium]|nr:FAD-binding protein [Candidatus Binatia bacterium]